MFQERNLHQDGAADHCEDNQDNDTAVAGRGLDAIVPPLKRVFTPSTYL